MIFEELSKDKIEVINSAIRGSPNFEDRWLTFFPVGSEILFDNPQLSSKVVNTGIWISGSAVYAYEIARRDGDNIDIDIHLLTQSGAGMLLVKGIKKDFQEHHPSKLPTRYY